MENGKSLFLQMRNDNKQLTIADMIMITLNNYEMNLLKIQKMRTQSEFDDAPDGEPDADNNKFSASNENIKLSWIGSKNSAKFTFKDIRDYSGEGYLKIFWFVDESDLEDVSKVLSKYRRKVFVLPVERYPVIDRKGRLQLGSRRSFLTEGLGLGSFCKTMKEKGFFQSMKTRGVKYVYLQPLTNLYSGIIDFDMLDIMLTTSQPDASRILNSHYNSNLSESIKVVRNTQVSNRNISDPDRDFKKRQKKPVKIFGSSDLGFERDKSKRTPIAQKRVRPKKTKNPQSKMVTSIDSDLEDDLKFDCISKIYDLEGDLALKVHDCPTDCLNSIKFFDPERGTNWSKLHSGDVVFSLERFMSSNFWRNYNYCKGNVMRVHELHKLSVKQRVFDIETQSYHVHNSLLRVNLFVQDLIKHCKNPMFINKSASEFAEVESKSKPDQMSTRSSNP